MKKILALLLAAMLVLTACSGGGDETSSDTSTSETEGSSNESEETAEGGESSSDWDFSGKTLRVAGLDGGYGTAGWEAVIAGFEEKTGAHVEATFEKNIYSVVRPEIQAGSPPDVLYNSIGQEEALTETMIKENMLTDLRDVFEMTVPGEDQSVGEKIIPGFLETSHTNPYDDGKTYLAPLFYAPNGLWYNKAMFTENGGPYELPTTMEEFLALGEEAEADGIALFTYPTTGYFDSFIPAVINSVGGPELYNKLMSYDADAWANEATPVFETIGSILEYLHPSTVAQANNESFTRNQLLVMQNEALFMPNGTWIVSEMADAESSEGVHENFEWGFMAVPAVDGGDRYAYSYFEQVFIPQGAAEPELAKAFIAYLYSDEAVQAFIDNGQVQPVLGAEELIEDENQKMFYSIYEDGTKATMGGFDTAPAVEGVSMSGALYDSINSVANGDMTVEEWQQSVVDAATRINEAIQAESAE